MPFIIPNAIDTTGSNRYNALDQAEPDALDFQILGNRATGVISGCGVTPQTVANYTVAVASGFVAINGVVYSVSSNPSLTLPAVPSNNRFDLVVARLSAGAVSITVVTGPDSASNPSFPPTPSRMTSTVGVPTSTWINPDTDVVLAAVYRSGAATITTAFIVDKRVNVPNTTSLRGDVAPPSTLGQNGDFYYKTSVSGSPGVYVKIEGAWTQLGLGGTSGGGPGAPIGTVITWVASTHPGTTEWLECIGGTKPRVGDYSGLFDAIGTEYGTGDGSTTFGIPDFRGVYLRGRPSTGETLGTLYGSDTVTLAITNLPAHNHPLTGSLTGYGGDHDHTAGTLQATSTGSGHVHTFTQRNFYGDNFNNAGPIFLQGTGTTANFSTINMSLSGSHTHGLSGYTSSHPGHQHSLSGASTDNTGSGTGVTINPRHYPVRYFIKYA